VGEDGHSVAQVAAAFGVGWGTVMAAVRDYGSVLVDDPARLEAVTALGLDETAFLTANRTHPTVFVTGIVDLSGAHPRLLDIVAGRSGKWLSDWVSARPAGWRAGVTVAALDPFRGYATALRTHLPARDAGAGRLPRDPAWLRRRGRRPPPGVARDHRAPRPPRRSAVPVRRLLRRGHDHHAEKSWARLLAGLAVGDNADEHIGKTWIAAQDLRGLYRCRDRRHAEQLDAMVLAHGTQPGPAR